jgi:hypothetical protein
MADNGHHVKRRFLANMLTCPQKTMNGGKQPVSAEIDKLLAVMLMFTMLQQMLNSFSNTVKSLITTGIYNTGLSRFFLLALLALALTSCAQHHRLQVQPSGPLSDCQSLFVQVDEEVKRANVQDYGPMRISGFPYLRVDRFSASFRESASGSTQMQTWTKRLAEPWPAGCRPGQAAAGEPTRQLPRSTGRQPDAGTGAARPVAPGGCGSR